MKKHINKMASAPVKSRFYPHPFPSIGDTVAAQVTEIRDGNVYCQLLEYNCQGMITGNELSRKKITNIRGVLPVGTIDYLEVTAVDELRGYLDLSKKRVTINDAKICKENYDITRKLHAFFSKWSTDDCNLVETVLWPEYDPDAEAHPYSGITVNFIDNSKLSAPIKNAFAEMFNPMIKYDLVFELLDYSENAVEKINAALDAGRKMSTDEFPLTIIYNGKMGRQGGTEYVISTRSNNPEAKDFLETVVEKIKLL